MIAIRFTVAAIAAVSGALVQDCSGIAPTEVRTTTARASEARASEVRTSVVAVGGKGIDHLTSAVVHSTKPTPTGMVRRSTEIVELSGDLNGRVLYHVTTVIDTVQGTLVNTGDQVYSGTVAGSAPVMVHDDRFRFEVDLKTGREQGRVYLLNHIAGPKVRCELHVVGTGMNAEGNPTFTYKGECRFAGMDH
jgi:hypothetical protein